MSAQLSDVEFGVLSGLLRRLAGLVFDESRRPALAAIAADRAKASGVRDIPSYLRHVGSTDGAEERQRLLDDVTIQETFFFRNLPQVDALRTQVLPHLLERAARHGRPLTVWSAGCSTGEEPYTLAMLLLELLAAVGAGTPAIRVVGTDVSAAAVRVAAEAAYPPRAVRLVDAAARERWFDQRPDGAWVVRDEVRRLVELRVHNLVTDPPPFEEGEVDLVLCRNVTIYFARETTRELIGRLHDVLSFGGYLVLGHAETLWQVSDRFTLVPTAEAFAYRKDPTAPRPLTARPRQSRPRALDVPVGVIPVGDVLSAAVTDFAAGRYAEAASAAAAAATADPLRAEAHLLHGHALVTLGRDDDALVPLRKTVYLDPRAGHAHFLLAGSLSRLGKSAAAARSFRTAAQTLHLLAGPDVEAVLDGRDVAELVELCTMLAEACESTETGPERRLA